MIRDEEVFAEDGVLEEHLEWVLEAGEGEENPEDIEEGDVPDKHRLNGERNTMRAEARPKPPVTHATAMKTKFYCPLCMRLCDSLDYDVESGIVKLDCRPIAHFRPVAMKTIGATS
jgi:hypothetical protein